MNYLIYKSILVILDKKKKLHEILVEKSKKINNKLFFLKVKITFYIGKNNKRIK